MALKYIIYEDITSKVPSEADRTIQGIVCTKVGAIKYYCNALDILPKYNSLTNVYRIDVDEQILYVMDKDRATWSVAEFESPNASLDKPIDFAINRYVVGFDADDKLVVVGNNPIFGADTIQELNIPLKINATLNHDNDTEVNALSVKGSGLFEADTDTTDIGDATKDLINLNVAADSGLEDWAKLRGALIASSGGLTVRKSGRIGGALIVEGISWNKVGAFTWEKVDNIPSIFRYNLYVEGVSECTGDNTGALRVSGGALFKKNAHVLGDLNVHGITYGAEAQFQKVNIVGGTSSALDISGSALISNNLSVTGSATIYTDLNVSGVLRASSIEGDLKLGGIETTQDLTYKHSIRFETNEQEVGLYFNDGRTYQFTPNITCPTVASNISKLLIRTTTLDGLSYNDALSIESSTNTPNVIVHSLQDYVDDAGIKKAALNVKGGAFIDKSLVANSIESFGDIKTLTGAISGLTVTAQGSNGVVYDLKELYTKGLGCSICNPTLEMLETSPSNLTQFRVKKGAILDDSKNVLISIDSDIVKSLQSVWASGNNQGCLINTQILTSNTTYHIYAIYNSATKVSDILAVGYYIDNIVLPTGFTHKKYIGSLITDASGNIVPFMQMGNKFVIQGKNEFVNAARDTGYTYLDIQYVAKGIKSENIFDLSILLTSDVSQLVTVGNYCKAISAVINTSVYECGFTGTAQKQTTLSDIRATVEDTPSYARLHITHSSSIGTFTLVSKGWVDYSI